MSKPPRASTGNTTELSVLSQSRRRCALCYHLKGVLAEKHGQIAHLDKNRANAAEDNLAFLCMEHHSVFDSTTSQHKNYTVVEVKAARSNLYKAIADGAYITAGSPRALPNIGIDTDRQTLSTLVELMCETGSIDFLRYNNFAGWSFEWSRLDGIQQSLLSNGPENEFLNADIEQLRAAFQEACYAFMQYAASNTFVVNDAGRKSIPEDWETEQPERFQKTVKEIHEASDAVCRSYDELIRAARKRLAA